MSGIYPGVQGTGYNMGQSGVYPASSINGVGSGYVPGGPNPVGAGLYQSSYSGSIGGMHPGGNVNIPSSAYNMKAGGVSNSPTAPRDMPRSAPSSPPQQGAPSAQQQPQQPLTKVFNC